MLSVYPWITGNPGVDGVSYRGVRGQWQRAVGAFTSEADQLIITYEYGGSNQSFNGQVDGAESVLQG